MKMNDEILRNTFGVGASVPNSGLLELAELHNLVTRGDVGGASLAVDRALRLLSSLAEPYPRAA